MFLTKDLPTDEKFPLSCVYWLYDTRKHTDPKTSGYVGVSSKGAEHRLKGHKIAAKNGSKLPVHAAIRKYGEYLGMKVLLLADPEFCLLAEYMLRPLPNMRGTLNIAMGGVISPTTGTNLSDETKRKIGLANSGSNNHWFGREVTKEERLIKSERFKGDKNPMFGIVPSEEMRDKLSRAIIDSGKRTKSIDTYKELLKSDPNNLRGYVGWRAPNADKGLWLRAEEIFLLFQSKGGCGVKIMSNMLNHEYTPSALATIVKKMRSGWNPGEDSTYSEWKTDYLAQAASGIVPKTFKVMPWENSSSTTKSRQVWVLADQMYVVVEADKGISSQKLGRSFGLTEASVVHINKKLREGWIPSEDELWVSFKNEHKQKETADAVA